MRFKNYMIAVFILFILANINVVAESDSENASEPYSEVLLVNNISGVQYQSRILGEFNKTSEVIIIVEVRDNSGIIITKNDTKEQQNIKDTRRKEFFDNKTNTVLSKLSEPEFKLRVKFPTGRGFSGNVTREGFEKLINDSNVAKIYLSGVSYIQPVIVVDEDGKEDEVVDTDENKSIAEGAEVVVEELIEEIEISNNLSKQGIVKETKKKSLLWFWITIIFVLIILILYLIIKIKKDEKQ